MFWQEEPKPVITVVDVMFDIRCPCLPVDHAYALSQAVSQVLPWFLEEPQAGLHLIHGASSGHGWYRPESLLYLSRRTRLTLRLPQPRVLDGQALTGKTLEVAGYPLTVGQAAAKPLSQFPVLLARHVIARGEESEEIFLQEAMQSLQALGIRCRKALCGKTSQLKGPEGELFTRSLMVADLNSQDSITLQQEGLGEGRKIGCGLFIPHKDIKPVNPGHRDDS